MAENWTTMPPIRLRKPKICRTLIEKLDQRIKSTVYMFGRGREKKLYLGHAHNRHIPYTLFVYLINAEYV